MDEASPIGPSSPGAVRRSGASVWAVVVGMLREANRRTNMSRYARAVAVAAAIATLGVFLIGLKFFQVFMASPASNEVEDAIRRWVGGFQWSSTS